MPEKVRQTFGFALGLAQNNLPYEDAKTLSAFKPSLVEILEDDDGDTYRAVYTAHFDDVVYVIHCFKKKSTKGRSIPRRDKETIEARLAEVKKIESEKAKLKKRASS
jgi:phage-related protein